jgi:hypothetical protein
MEDAMHASPKGRTTGTNAPLPIAGRVEIAGWKPQLLVYVRTGSKQLLRDWRYWCQRLGLVADVAQAFGDGYVTAFLVFGLPESLYRLVDGGFKFVERWEYVMDTRVPFQAVGSGPEKAKPSKARHNAKATVENPGGYRWGPPTASGEPIS